MAEVDNAEAVTVGVCEFDKVWNFRISIPGDPLFALATAGTRPRRWSRQLLSGRTGASILRRARYLPRASHLFTRPKPHFFGYAS